MVPDNTFNDPISTCIENGQSQKFCEKVCKNFTLPNNLTGDALNLMKCLPNNSVDLIVTSPPYADARKSQYGCVHPDKYVEWFAPFSDEMLRVLKDDGSFVLNIKDRVVNSERHTYVYDLVRELKDRGWKWIDTYIWQKKNPMPRRVVRRFKDGFEYIHHFTKNIRFKFHPERVKIPISAATAERWGRLRGNDHKRRESVTGSGFGIHNTKMAKKADGKAYPSNVLKIATVASSKGHPAAFPEQLPEFFIKAMSDEGDVVLDPFAGSGTTLKVAKENCRTYLGFDKKEEYTTVGNGRLDQVNSVCEK